MKPAINNFVAKHAPRNGAGAHKIKHGQKASRARQKQNLRRDLNFSQ